MEGKLAIGVLTILGAAACCLAQEVQLKRVHLSADEKTSIRSQACRIDPAVTAEILHADCGYPPDPGDATAWIRCVPKKVSELPAQFARITACYRVEKAWQCPQETEGLAVRTGRKWDDFSIYDVDPDEAKAIVLFIRDACVNNRLPAGLECSDLRDLDYVRRTSSGLISIGTNYRGKEVQLRHDGSHGYVMTGWHTVEY